MIPYNEPVAFQTISRLRARTGGQVQPAGRFTDFLDAAARGLDLEDYRSNPVVLAYTRAAEPTAACPLPASLGAYAQSSRSPAPLSGTWAPSQENTIEDLVDRAALCHDLSPELISAVIRAESGFNSRAVSPAGAMGLMQLMPATARELGADDPFDPAQNIDAGAKYLRQMLDLFDQDLEKALMAYNAGPGTVQKYEGRVPYAETLAYVDRVMTYAGAA